METKWASLVSYGLTVEALKDFLPLDETLSVSIVRTNTLAIAQRCEAELGDEQLSFIDSCPRDWGNLPLPDGPITVGIDRRYVRDWEQKQCHFAVVSKRFCKRQQMQWTRKGAHLLLQTRVKILNHKLGVMFRRWYPDFHVKEEEVRAA